MLYDASFPNAHSQISNLTTFTKDESPFGLSYAEWVAKWWQWNTLRDNTVYNTDECGNSPNGVVWFVPDVLAGEEDRTCTVPFGTAILIPINTGICWNDGNPQPMNDRELLSCATEGQDNTFFNVFVNNTKFDEKFTERIQSPYFNITIPRDSYTRYHSDDSGNVVECQECRIGIFRALADGYFVFINPSIEGKYDVTYSYDTISNPNPELQHAAKVNYHIIVANQ